MPNSCELGVLMAVLYSPAPVQFPLVFDDDDDGDDNVEMSNASCKILQTGQRLKCSTHLIEMKMKVKLFFFGVMVLIQHSHVLFFCPPNSVIFHLFFLGNTFKKILKLKRQNILQK